MKTFGETLKKERVGKKVTLRELGTKVGVSVSYISDIEHGRKNPPNLEVVRKMEDFLGLKKGVLVSMANNIRSATEEFREKMRRRPQLSELLLRADQLSDEKLKKIIESMEE
jgi:transcriptional regulator with XRE-family HTH domain